MRALRARASGGPSRISTAARTGRSSIGAAWREAGRISSASATSLASAARGCCTSSSRHRGFAEAVERVACAGETVLRLRRERDGKPRLQRIVRVVYVDGAPQRDLAPNLDGQATGRDGPRFSTGGGLEERRMSAATARDRTWKR